jgi:L-iditol 2-dehydrogenase
VEPALEMMSEGVVDVSFMPTHRFAFEDTQKAFELVAEYKDGVMKAMIDFE